MAACLSPVRADCQDPGFQFLHARQHLQVEHRMGSSESPEEGPAGPSSSPEAPNETGVHLTTDSHVDTPRHDSSC